MVETSVRIPSGNGVLEALYGKGHGLEVMILCHPHPLYGGTMDNSVVATLQKVYAERGWGTLRFNFRAVGGSTEDATLGDESLADLMAVVGYLRAQGARHLHIAGYSFGAWIALKAINDGFLPESTVLISPPLDFLPFDAFPSSLLSKPCLITLGEQDQYCRPESLLRWLADRPQGKSTLDVAFFPKVDHFYWGFEEALSLKFREFLEKYFPPHAA